MYVPYKCAFPTESLQFYQNDMSVKEVNAEVKL